MTERVVGQLGAEDKPVLEIVDTGGDEVVIRSVENPDTERIYLWRGAIRTFIKVLEGSCKDLGV